MPESIESKLPDIEELQDQFEFALNYWEGRDEFIRVTREMAEGDNDIEVPSAVGYKAVAVHSYTLAGLLNEKVARYMSQPEIKVPVKDPLDDESRAESSELEMALSHIFYEMESKGDGDTWNQVITDAILLDCGVEIIESTKSATWVGIDQATDREAYKMDRGVPLRTIYVPLENIFPVFEGPERICTFRVEVRSLWSALQSKNFDQKLLRDRFSTNRPMQQDVAIVHMIDDNYHAYYLLHGDIRESEYSRAIARDTISAGQLDFLYGYKHNLGFSIVNMVGGRYGGWKTDSNRIEKIGKGLLELNQGLDEVYSQVYTNIRARYWPNLNFKVNPELRVYPDPSNPPTPPQINDGESIVTYVGEEIVPIFPAQNDPTVPWFVNMLKEQVGKLGGSSVLFGERQPGVETGYHNAQQLSQAEHLDNKIEEHLVAGAANRARIVLGHIREFNEPIYVYGTSREEGGNTLTGRYYTIDPKDLTPLPRLESRVRKPKPIDILTAVRAAREASDDRGGKGPLLSDDTIGEEILALAFPDIERKKITLEEGKRKLLASNILMEKVSERLNMGLAKKGTPNISPEMLGKADPQLLQALMQMVGSGQELPGGISPMILQQLMGAGGGPPQQPGGPPGEFNRGNSGPLPTEPQLENRMGESASRAARL